MSVAELIVTIGAVAAIVVVAVGFYHLIIQYK